MSIRVGIDARLYARFYFGKEAEVHPEEGADPMIGRLIDIGLGGVSVETGAPLPLNSKFRLNISHKSRSLSVKCQVLYCNENEGVYTIGVKFATEGHHERVKIAEFVFDVFQSQSELMAS
jgi:hypothetical protein